jgi:hypothetical protein
MLYRVVKIVIWIVHRVEAEVRRVRGGAHIGRDGRFVDADDVVPAAFDQVVHHRGTHDAALADDDNLGSFRKCGHLQRACNFCLQPIVPSARAMSGPKVYARWALLALKNGEFATIKFGQWIV